MNLFTGRQCQIKLINHVLLVSRRNPDKVINDYYRYVLELLLKNLRSINKRCIIFFDYPKFRLLAKLLPVIYIDLQIEHTLVKPGGRDSEGSLVGGVQIKNSHNNYLIRIANFSKLNQADIIFDYSRINLFNIRSTKALQDYSRKSFCISPALYSINTNPIGRNGIITLFGNVDEPRRKSFLEDLKRHRIDSKNISGIYFGIDEIYRKTKIVINIRQTDYHDTLEELRVLPALRSGAIVICESAPCVEKTWYSKYIIWGTVAQLPQLIADTEKNYDQIHLRIFGSLTTNSSFLVRMLRIERCNELASNRAIKLMNKNLTKT